MKETKRRFEAYSFYDHTGIALHLEKMAEKGWLIEQMTGFGWTYRRIEPKKLHFFVSYYPRASEFDPEPSEDQKAFYDFCEHTGWILAAASAQLQVFYNEQANPVPIETDPGSEISIIHRAARKTFLPAYMILMIVSILGAALFVFRLLGDPVGLLASASGMFTGFAWTMLLLLCIAEPGGYYLWRHRARKAAERGEFLATSGYAVLQRGILCVVLIGFVCWIVTLLTAASSLMRAAGLLMVFYMGALMLLVNAVKQFLKKKKAPAGVNRAVTTTASFVLAFAMMGLIIWGSLKAVQSGIFDPDRQADKSNDFTPYLDEPPLAVEDLRDTEYAGEYIRELRSGESPLLGQFELRQHARNDAEHRLDMPGLKYTITQIKLPALYELCKNALMGAEKNEAADGEAVFSERWQAADALPWGAAEAYRYDWGEAFRNSYLLCYEDRIVEIAFDWEPTPEQMAAVGEKLGLK